MDLSKLIDREYIFEATPAPLNKAYLFILLGFFVFLIILAIVENIWLKRIYQHLPPVNKLRASLFNFFLYSGIIGLLLIFFRWQQINWFSNRFLLILFFVTVIIWLLYILIFVIRKLPKEVADFHQKKEFEKYLPRKKNE